MQVRPIHAAAPCWKNAEGEKTSWEALLVGVRLWNRSSGFWETKNSWQQLGAWASSEEEQKPTRGTWEAINCFLGGLGRENPVGQSGRMKAVRGALKQYWR
jgi:hypothetical protein